MIGDLVMVTLQLGVGRDQRDVVAFLVLESVDLAVQIVVLGRILLLDLG